MTKCAAPVDPNSIVIPKKPANKSASEHRKITKPIMEKRRRARINQSLEQLKQILIEQFNECSKKSNNLEKADILELTVKHLRDITAKQNQLNQQVVKQQQSVNTQLAHNNNNQQLNQLLSKQMNHQLTQQQSPVKLKNNELITFNKNLINRTSSNFNNINNQILTKKGVRLIQDGFKECKQHINECLSQVDKQLNERLNDHLIKFEKKQFEQGKFNCDQVLNLSIHDHLLANNLQAGNLILHTPSSACSSSSSNVFFPQNSSNGGSLSPGSERSLSPSSDSSSVWRPW